MDSLDTVRDPAIHAQRRKVWDHAFSVRSLHEAESLIYHHTDKLILQLRKRQSQPLNIYQWLEYYSFDAMGKFGLSVDFDNLSGNEHPIMNLYHIAHRRLGPLAAAPWVKHLLMGIPFIERMKHYRMFFKWAFEELDKNIEANGKEERADIIGCVIRDAIKHGGIKKNWNFVLGDFVLVIVAGSDPVRQVLANLLYYLILNPDHLERLRDELSKINIRNYRELQQNAPHLNMKPYS
ncbi:cytochrome P450 [Hypoxylon sp. NC1633]|nr:cytochrome P450 [Hypoxylon sp. NC1633]